MLNFIQTLVSSFDFRKFVFGNLILDLIILIQRSFNPDKMETTQRSKSFKALSMAQPIRKDIQQTLNQLQQQKRRYLAADREQFLLKQQIAQKKSELDKLKKNQVPASEIDEKRATQTDLKLRNTDRAYESTLGNIQKIKQQIDTIRKTLVKYKKTNAIIDKEQKQVIAAIDTLVQKIVQKQKTNDELKQQIVNHRDQNIKNLNEFKKSHMNLTKSNYKDENERKRFAVTTKTFLGEEYRQSRVVHYDKISDTLKNSGIVTNEGNADILANSVPIAKSRVNVMIHANKDKIKIADNYMKFGQALENMFKIIKEYKGRDDVDYIAEEFVKKQTQIQKLGEYIGKLEYQIVSAKRKLQKKENQETELEKQLTKDNHSENEKHYKEMSQFVKAEIEQYKLDNIKMNEWMKKVGELLCPLAEDDDFSRGNAVNVIGKIQQKLAINRAQIGDRKLQSPMKSTPAPPIEPQDHHQKYAQLLSYDKMREMADEYIKTKRAN